MPLKTQPSRDFYRENGYYVFRNGLREAGIREVREALESEVMSAERPLLRLSGKCELNDYVELPSGARLIRNALFDPHSRAETPELARTLKQLICNDGVADLLSSVIEYDSYIIQQAILFFLPATTETHIDGWHSESWPPGNACTIWLPLEPVTLRNGPVYIMPWRAGRVLSPQSLGIADLLAHDSAEAYQIYHRALNRYIEDQQTTAVVPLLNAADFLLFSSATPHGTIPYRNPVSRLAVQVIVRGADQPFVFYPGQFTGEFLSPPFDPSCYEVVNSRWRIWK
jgi:ectoine hydroxylase-related dioxygenase (phytanoyl-CoA dioxygenase family)